MIKITHIKKIGYRFLVVNIVFLLIKLTVNHEENRLNGEDPINEPIFYYVSAVILFLLTWQVNDWLIKRNSKKNILKPNIGFSNSLKILIETLAIVLTLTALIYYLAIFEFNYMCKIDSENPWLQFRIDFFRAALLLFSLSVCNLFYYMTKRTKEIENSMHRLKQEVMTSKYNSLKNQISPHFLFNSLNILTSLMYQDRDLASDFVTRLASCYRYILDNKEEDLVSLEKEMNFLDSFIFMMNVRHKESLYITTHISVNPKDFLIPTLSLQMLVENALKHNYFSKEKPLEISIFFINNKSLVVQNTLRKRKEEPSTKLGISNIKKRYAFYTNEPVTIEEENNIYKIAIPLLQKTIKQFNISLDS
ncbi:histidine kinase [Flavivirga abyssicola]|uniref:sensor histidine kinase n=1 Tax=Flavivirga abyssicola TaxID=3063533 RepID=UPI0026DF9D9F|nr:histidine kinase [Flavivirga sp. MEBiC07777]WVK14476.1 histidine kinase [Flavivirga sp. MEBiC07777]